MSDWTGNTNSIFKIIGASNHAEEEREKYDFYATDPAAIDMLLDDGKADLAPNVRECACGGGHLSNRLKERGYNVYATDLIDRGAAMQCLTSFPMILSRTPSMAIF